MELWRRERSVTVAGRKTVWRPAAGLRGPSTPVTRSPARCAAPRPCVVPVRARAVTTTAATTRETNVGMTMDVVVTVTVMDVEFSVLQAYLNQTRLSATRNLSAFKGYV